ncbi:MAG: hypothetical protein A2541_01025 [Candidatus Taylorbacteria bacterium RIFOXYD2_FULL_36_9]|uniref:Uncharacterized protein n=1 Tax=Candidatus Taylorbacteria bacterium RIFOXYD2_FULL_36_9 TaxID=1802338 RepID=A0A1G2PF62_9BACT|nr:MAG: hypothetical protein A2541_01025 [Candidatus Taylorbacteria bacterium RIFOXYD2_FULL_36_9]
MGLLTNIRQKSDGSKKLLALIIAIILTLIIVGLWFSFTAKTAADDQIVNQKPSLLSSLSPWQVIKEEFSKVFSDLSKKSDVIIPVEVIEATTSDSLTL